MTRIMKRISSTEIANGKLPKSPSCHRYQLSWSYPIRKYALINGVFVLSLGLMVGTAMAQEQELKPTVVLDGLIRPCGVAVQAETGHIFVAESGAGRVVRVVEVENGEPNVSEVLDGFTLGDTGIDPRLQVGPCGLAFLGRSTLLVAASGEGSDRRGIFVANLSKDSTSAGELVHLSVEGVTANGLYSVATSGDAVFGSMLGQQSVGRVVAAKVLDAKKLDQREAYGPLRAFVTTSPSVGRGGPAGLAVSNRGELVVGSTGAIDGRRNSQVAFYRATNGELLLKLDADLFDIVAICYGAPQSGATKPPIYALDLAWSQPDQGGLFRLDAELHRGELGIRPKKIASLMRPTSMVLADSGALYITVLGSDDETGQLLRFDPGL